MVCPTSVPFITPPADAVPKDGNHDINGAYYRAAIAELEHWDEKRDQQWHDHCGEPLYDKLMEERWAQFEAAALSLRAPGDSSDQWRLRTHNCRSSSCGRRWPRHIDRSSSHGSTRGRQASATELRRTSERWMRSCCQKQGYCSGDPTHRQEPDSGVRRHTPAVQVLIERQNAAKSVSTQTPSWRPRTPSHKGSTATNTGSRACGTTASTRPVAQPPARAPARSGEAVL